MNITTARRVLQRTTTRLGLAIIGLFVAGALAQPVLLATVWDPAVYDPVSGHSAQFADLLVVEEVVDPSRQIDLVRARLRHDPGAQIGQVVAAAVQPAPPNPRHLLGTDPRGRDVLSQLLFGARHALIFGVIAALVAGVGATVVAAAAAFFRGAVEVILLRIAELFVVLPALVLLMFLSALRDLRPWMLGIAFGVAAGLGPAAIVLARHATTISTREFVDAARLAGHGPSTIIVRHLVPNLAPLAALSMMFTVAAAIAAEAVLSLFGLIDVPMSWGIMLNLADAGGYLTYGFTYWWLLLPAGAAVSLLAAGFYLVARGVDEVVSLPAAVRNGRE